VSRAVQVAPRYGRPPILHLALVLAVALLVFVPCLGRGGFTATEGHRVIPGWEMLQTHDWFLPTMFGQVYLRKPPGMPWAVAASAALLGESEFSARLVSAVSMCSLALAAAWFGGRWFGRRHGLWAGLATALTPALWPSARAAEIEALNNLGAGLAVFLVIDLLLLPPRRGWGWLARGTILGLALCIAALAKGPAAAPAVLGAGLGACIAVRSLRPLLSPAGIALALGVLLCAGTTGLVVLKLAAAAEGSGQTPVLQGASDFTWIGRPLTPSSIGRVLAMPAVALAASLPWGLAMLFPWGPDARAEADRTPEDARILACARAITLASLLGIALLLAAGVRNPRYAQPCIGFVPILAAYTARGIGTRPSSPAFLPLRRKLAALMCGQPTLALCAAAAAAYIIALEPSLRPESGRTAGYAIAEYLKPGDTVLADHIIEARPEIVLYARQRTGNQVRYRWVPALMGSDPIATRPPPDSAVLLLRCDAESGELQALETRGLKDRYHETAVARVHKFEVGVFRWRR
jgi:4-amino-4-deoxy-L-arabinose transferase-like glycosyltransferase